MADIQITSVLTGDAELKEKLKTLSSEVKGRIAEDAVTEGASVIQFWAQENARDVFSERQRGQLRNSIMYEVQRKGEGAEAEIGPGVIYGRIQELGGTIRPIRAKALHFVIDGKDFFAKSVTIQPHPYLGPAVEDHQDQIMDVIGKTIDDGIREAA